MESAEPPFPAYRRTLAALKRYLDLARRDDGEPLPAPAKTVEPGDAYAGVPRLTRLLTLLGDLPESSEAANENIYQGLVVDAVKHFQQRHGLEADGRIGKDTLRELNTPLGHRVLQLKLSLERWRWLPREFARPPVVVNIPEFRLRADNDEYQWILSMKIVVGKAYGHHQTPVFASEIKGVIFHPYWDVPIEIGRKELLPDVDKDRFYLSKHAYQVVDKNKRVVLDEGPLGEEIEAEIRSGQLAIRQKPGSQNALGPIKFDMPNPYDVYLHGTPAMRLFAKSRRDFSHGCIRVEDPVALATWVLREEPGWTLDRIQAAVEDPATLRAALRHPIPVWVLYSTVAVMEDNEVRFFKDIYERDAELANALARDRAD